MAEVHEFTYGVFNPIAAGLLGFVGAFFGLLCAARAQSAGTRSRRTRWLTIAAFTIGGGGIWLMHLAAVLGFEVPASPVRYDLVETFASLVIAVLSVWIGLMLVGHGKHDRSRILRAGLITGGGIAAMHYTAMAGLNVSGSLHYNPILVAASVLLAIVAATTGMWFTVSITGWGKTAGAAAILAAMVCGIHYTVMAALSVRLGEVPAGGVSGVRPLTMIVPITVITAAMILGVAWSALQAMTDEEFTDGVGTPKRGVHAENHPTWSRRPTPFLINSSRTGDTQPLPRPTALRRAQVADRVGS